jgi:chromosome segregation ATPase
MTTAVAFTKADLDQVFDEIEDAQADVKDRTGKLQDAEQRAAAVKGLTTAAQNALRSAEGNLQLLTLAKDETESKSAGYAKISERLAIASDDFAEADKRATAVNNARQALAEINTALEGWVTTAKRATAAFGRYAEKVRNLPVDDAAKSDRRNLAEELAGQGTSLDSELDQLGEPQKERLREADRQLEGSALSPAQLGALKGKVTRLQGELDRIGPKPGKAPDPGEIQQAQADVEAAKTAVEEAPEIERDRQAKLRLARENLAAAQDGLTAALAAKEAAERSWIEGIDLIGPGADGSVIAKAKLASTPLPNGYSLEWTFDGVPVASDPAGNIRFDTKELAAGSYAIAVHLHRD